MKRRRKGDARSAFQKIAADRAAPLRQRMYDYYQSLRRRHGLPVVPIALFLRVGLEGTGWETYEESFWGRELVRFSYPYIGLSALDAEKYVRQDNWLGVALSALMNVSKERRIELAREVIERLVHCPESLDRKLLLCECVSAYLPVNAEQRQQFEVMVRNHPDERVRAMELGLLDHVEQRGLEKGIEKGREQGKPEGQRELLCKQLEARFGPLPSSVVDHLQTWPNDRLADLGCRLLSATSLDELGLGSP